MSKLQDLICQMKSFKEKGICVLDNKGEHYLPYYMCYKRAIEIAHQMATLPSKYVIVIQDKNFDYLPEIWAGILTGKIVVPMNIGTAAGSIKELYNVWNFLDKPNIVMDLSLKDKLTNQNYSMDNMFFFPKKMDIIAEFNVSKQAEENIALLMFSSGTTGEPKGVELTSENIVNAIDSLVEHYNFTSEDVFLNWMSMTHAIGLNIFHLVPMYLKATQIILNQSLFISNPKVWMEKVSFYKVTVTGAVNFGLNMDLKSKLGEKIDLSKLRILIVAGEPVSATIISRFINKYSCSGLKENSIKNLYGMTESVLGITAVSKDAISGNVVIDRRFLNVGDTVHYLECRNDLKDGNTYNSSGVALKNVEVRLVNDSDEYLAENKIGHIQIKGKSITNGYHKINNFSFFTPDGWLRTGDIGFLRSNHELVIVGREKDIIIINGKNYYCLDLERILQENVGIHVGDVAVASIFNGALQAEIPIVFIKKSIFPDQRKLEKTKKMIKRNMSLYAGIRIERIVEVEEIPRTAAGKILRRKLVNNYIKS